MRRVSKVAKDTARGRTLQLCRHMYKAGVNGQYLATLAHATGHTEDKERNLLHFLSRIGAAELFVTKVVAGVNSRPKWRLTPRLMRLYEEVLGAEDNGNS